MVLLKKITSLDEFYSFLFFHKLLRKSTWHILLLLLLAQVTLGQIPVPEVKNDFSLVNTSLNSYVSKPKVTNPKAENANYYNSFNSMSQKQQHEQLMREVETYQARQKQLIDDALKTLEESAIDYNLKGKNIPGRNLFNTALKELKSMLNGEQPLNIKKAVFLSEYAYDPSLSWEDFNSSIDDMTTHVGYYMQNKRFDAHDNNAKNLALFNFFTDTLKVKYPTKEGLVTTYPLFYDFDDFWGRNDRNKMFVSKLIKDGTGQCHSLPLLYLILAEEIGAEAHLAFAPNHSYIKIQDKKGDWLNIELTTQSFTSDQYIMQTGFVKSASIINKVYMNPASKKEVIAQCVNDLTMNYIQKFGYDDFVLKGTNTAISSGTSSITAHLINHNYYQELLRYILEQYKHNGLSQEQLNNDEKAKYVYDQVNGLKKAH